MERMTRIPTGIDFNINLFKAYSDIFEIIGKRTRTDVYLQNEDGVNILKYNFINKKKDNSFLLIYSDGKVDLILKH